MGNEEIGVVRGQHRSYEFYNCQYTNCYVTGYSEAKHGGSSVAYEEECIVQVGVSDDDDNGSDETEEHH